MAEPAYVRECEAPSSMGDRIVLYYFTTERKPSENEFGRTTYGVGIEMYTQLPDSRTVKEKKVIEDVFIDKYEAEQFIDLLCKTSVTPVSLADVIYDYISEEAM